MVPKTEALTRNLLVRLSPSLSSRLSEHAHGNGLSMSAVVRMAIERLLAEAAAHTREDPNLPGLAGLVATEHVRFLVESFLPDPQEATLVARARAVDSALERLDELSERFGRAD